MNPHPALQPHQAITRRTRLRSAALAIAVGALALVLVACGGGSPGVANLGSSAASPSASGSNAKNALAFSQCMRAHGVSNFPDPGASGGITVTGNGGKGGLNPSDPNFQAAQNACKSLLPNGGQISPAQQEAFQAAALKFSQCMRAHGIAGFPDPQFSGGGVGITLPSSVNPKSPQFEAAQQACQSLLPKPNGGAGQTTTGGPQGGSGSVTGPVSGGS
jgi:hypothetical protein